MKIKYFFTLIVLAATLLACGRANKPVNSEELAGASKKDSEWKNRFKDLMLCNCVLAGMGDSTITNKFLTKDKTLYDPINIVMENDINEVLGPVILAIKRDSIRTLSSVGEGAQGKTVFSHCINFYKSSSLDSIADQKLLKWHHTNIDSMMAVKAPAY